MGKPLSDTFKLHGKEYEISDLSENGQEKLKYLNFTNSKIVELNKLHAGLLIARKTTISELKKEIINRKAGLIIDSI